jgi:demethylmenaquinone methyltransferase/2-methoxy-6-polyprenyl-1,4-benzoquinol methylase/phosphoethanolamine N-methyltransferase
MPGPEKRAGTASAPHTEGKTIRWARLYDFGTTLLSFGRASMLRRKILELADVAPGDRILDVGCGPGRLAIVAGTMVGPSGEVCGIDPAPEMIALARENAGRAVVRVRFEVGVIEALPYADDGFDLVLSSLMLHHLPDDLKRRGLAEVSRVLRPGGRLVAVDFGATPRGGLDHLLCILGLREGHDHAERLREMVHEAGFSRSEIGAVGQRGLMFIRGWKPTRAVRA